MPRMLDSDGNLLHPGEMTEEQVHAYERERALKIASDAYSDLDDILTELKLAVEYTASKWLTDAIDKIYDAMDSISMYESSGK